MYVCLSSRGSFSLRGRHYLLSTCVSSMASPVPGASWELRRYVYGLEVLSPAAFTYAVHSFLATTLQNITTLVSTEELSLREDDLLKTVTLVNGKIRIRSCPSSYGVLLFRQRFHCYLAVVECTLFSPFHSIDLSYYALQLQLSTSSYNCSVFWAVIAPHGTWAHMPTIFLSAKQPPLLPRDHG